MRERRGEREGSELSAGSERAMNLSGEERGE
jgi:hypothetical protein